ncbi:ABC transporter permease [Nocardia stercoris]|uniref:ABC transporter permease n=1 Tax=Nocardia stercoris TaxID=2483361 RepID=A0A3M2LE65_9NOCA|nr:FtsX-like permease family protein [Nocardia stercoris]RMI35752.1 ABC transporter permease [Nocardia stercoris]
MRKVALRNLAAHKVRLALTLLAVVLGTAFVAGSFVFTDTLQHTFDGIFADQAKGVDVRVQPKQMQSLGVPLDMVDRIAATDGVRAVAPAEQGPIVVLRDGKPVQTGGAPSFGMSYLPPEQSIAAPKKFVAGTPPAATGEVAVNNGGADHARLHVGDHVKVLIPSHGTVEVTVTGLYDLASDSGGYIGMLFPAEQAKQLFTDGQHVAYVDIAAKPGVPPDTLRDRIAKDLPNASNFKVLDGDQVRADLKAQIGQALKFVNYFLLAFGAIALVVGTFIIYNTFSMIVAQRLREMALLRAIGASRSQVGNSVIAEATVIGLLGSALGLIGGIGLAFGLSALLDAFSLGLPTGALQVLPRTFVVAILVGLVVTVASAYVPARRAAKTPPVEAMRAEFASTGDTLRWRTVGGAVLGVAGAVLVALGAQHTGKSAAIVVGIGSFALILSALMVSPWVSRPVVAVLGVLVRPFGAIGNMSRNNAIRNPRRTAATAFALTLGVMLVTAIGMLGASAKASVGSVVDQGVKADYILAGPQGGALVVLPLGTAQAVKTVPGVAEAVSMRGVAAKVGDDTIGGISPDGPMDHVIDFSLSSGVSRLGADDIMVSETQAGKYNWHAGQRVGLTNVDGKQFTFTVAGVYKDTPLLGPLVVPDAVYQQMMGLALRADIIVLVKAAPGTDAAALRPKLEDAVKAFGVVQVDDREQFKGQQGKQINTILAILYGLLALAVVIAILGIVNTLALSVVERRREIGMLRAVGMQRKQVRRTIYLESMLIAVFGAAVGVALGLTLGFGFLSTLSDLGLGTIVVPWSQVIAMLIGSGVVGVLAALWPGVRAARTPPLAAIADL